MSLRDTQGINHNLMSYEVFVPRTSRSEPCRFGEERWQDEATHGLPMFAIGFSYPSSDVKPGCEGLINSPMSKLWTVPGH